MEGKEIAIVPVEKILVPAVSPEEAKETWKKYLALKEAIIEVNDIQKFQGKDFLKKSYWRKLGTFFNISVECVSDAEKIVEKGDKFDIIYYVRYRAIGGNGRYAEGDGACNLWEKNYKNTIHNTKSTAHTRAYNRAISNLVGGGEVSAEEIGAENETENTHNNTNATVTPQTSQKPTPTNTEGGPISKPQQKRLFALLSKSNKKIDDLKKYLLENYNVISTENINWMDYANICDWIEEKKEEPKKEPF